MNVADILRPRGGMSHAAVFTLFGIHSTKYVLKKSMAEPFKLLEDYKRMPVSLLSINQDVMSEMKSFINNHIF